MIWFIIILLYCYLNSLTKKKAKDIFFFLLRNVFVSLVNVKCNHGNSTYYLFLLQITQANLRYNLLKIHTKNLDRHGRGENAEKHTPNPLTHTQSHTHVQTQTRIHRRAVDNDVWIGSMKCRRHTDRRLPWRRWTFSARYKSGEIKEGNSGETKAFKEEKTQDVRGRTFYSLSTETIPEVYRMLAAQIQSNRV